MQQYFINYVEEITNLPAMSAVRRLGGLSIQLESITELIEETAEQFPFLVQNGGTTEVPFGHFIMIFGESCLIFSPEEMANLISLNVKERVNRMYKTSNMADSILMNAMQLIHMQQATTQNTSEQAEDSDESASKSEPR